jgi:glycosyltransferase involved in cell wall biosynthesis
VREGETGYVVPVGDEPAMAARIRLLIENPSLRDRLGSEGHRRTIGEFDYDRMVADVIDIYDETLNLRVRPRMVS